MVSATFGAKTGASGVRLPLDPGASSPGQGASTVYFFAGRARRVLVLFILSRAGPGGGWYCLFFRGPAPAEAGTVYFFAGRARRQLVLFILSPECERT